ncbi:M20 metallopeptidase family protein [Anaerococcus sp. Marseille-P9784]|uniref:M20 metallopeptidase family protein n=1 Tax=Anaerococcus sp. Marseille-P9784 TaxID=2614127 RepID=UPI00124A6E4D|nr:M20 family metallopeptidase [Anaerococcus sp. Marseille-P9784]
MNNYFKKALEYKGELIEKRRALHQIPEVGLDLPKTKAYVKSELEGLGLKVKEYGSSGLSTLIQGEKGQGKCIMIRADMDALPMNEESGLPFASTGNTAHTCGHDLHSAIALTAAKILLEEKANFKGTVKFMFQPAEEIFAGSRMMIENGLLENPKVDRAIALHTALDRETGSICYNEGYIATSSDNFKITIKGKGGHGAYPHTTIDPINVAVNIYTNFLELIARESPPQETNTLTFGMLSAGSNSNIIPEIAEMQGTLRSYNPEVRNKLKTRMLEIIEGLKISTKAEIDLDFFTGVPSLYSDPEFTREIVGYIKNSDFDGELIPDTQVMASEDMALVAEKVPTAYFNVNCKLPGNNFSHHNPKVNFDENMMPIGLGLMLTAVVNWLNNN